MKNILRRLGLGLLILACAGGAARAQHHYPPLEFADDLAALGKPLTAPIVGLTTPDFYNLYLEQAIDAGRLQLRTRGQ